MMGTVSEEYRFLNLREQPELKQTAAGWFHDKWGVPAEAYLTCMTAYLNRETELGWYLCQDGDSIVAGLGVIENDFHVPKGVGKKQMQILVQDFPSSPRRKIEGDVVHRRDFPTKNPAEKTSKPEGLPGRGEQLAGGVAIINGESSAAPAKPRCGS